MWSRDLQIILRNFGIVSKLRIYSSPKRFCLTFCYNVCYLLAWLVIFFHGKIKKKKPSLRLPFHILKDPSVEENGAMLFCTRPVCPRMKDLGWCVPWVGRGVPCTSHPLYEPSLGRGVPRVMRPWYQVSLSNGTRNIRKDCPLAG